MCAEKRKKKHFTDACRHTRKWAKSTEDEDGESEDMDL